jgi:hypothetical protein
MRNGDFREVAARYPAFGLYNPMTGGAEGTGREQFPSFQIPAGMISPIARAINNYYPLPNSDIDINGNGLLDDYTQAREVRHDRDSFDLKLTWQRTTAHQIWGKFSMLDAEVIDNFNLGWDNGSIGDTRVYVPTVGHTWTLGPTMVLDSNFGMNRQDQTVTGPDYGQNIGLDLGIPGTNGPDIRQSGMPTFANGYTIGGTPSWMPLFRKEKSYTFSTAVTKLAGRHQIRSGFDFVRHQLNHVQAEQGPYGVRGGFSFSGLVTATPGVLPLAWNQYAAFLLGQPNFFSKDVQTEEMIGRENQFGLYVRDRWEVRRNLTLNLGLRLEAYPLMNRDTRGLERLEYDTYTVLIGGFGGVPRDVGLNVQTFYLAPAARRGVARHRGQRGAGRVWAYVQRAAVVASAARLVPAGHLLQQDRRQLLLDDHPGGRDPAGAGARHQLGACPAAARRVHAVAQSEPARSQRDRPDQRRLRAAAARAHFDGSRLRAHAHRRRLCRSEPQLR